MSPTPRTAGRSDPDAPDGTEFLPAVAVRRLAAQLLASPLPARPTAEERVQTVVQVLGGTPWDETSPDSLPPRLLGPFDPVLPGWAAREWVTGPHRSVVTINGVFRAIALVAGQAAGTWTMPAGQVSLAPFEPLPAAVEAALRAEMADVQRFFGTGLTDGGASEVEWPGART